MTFALEHPPSGATGPAVAPSSLDSYLEATTSGREAATSLDEFLREPDPGKALRLWLGPVPAGPRSALKRHILGRLSRDIARLDALLTEQVNAILHHPSFQKLEASWRSLRFLVDQAQAVESKEVKVRVFNVSWKELTNDLERAVEFDQSELFRKVYNEEFGAPGGKPFGVLLGDYEVRHRMSGNYPYNDVETLGFISQVAAAAFAPFVAAAHPSLFLLESDNFSELEKPFNLPQIFEDPEYLKWKEFRKKEESRFVGLTMPRVLARLPYVDDSGRADGFRFREDVKAPGRRGYLWGNAAYAFGAVLIRAFVSTGWLADIRGAPFDLRGSLRGEVGGGMVAGLPAHSFGTDRRGVAPKCSTDAIITDDREKELGTLGFIPLCYCQDTELAAFYGNQSVQEARSYHQSSATLNARMSAMLQYILCASRFAHGLKVMARNMTGSLISPDEIQRRLHSWLQRYVSVTASPERPLRQGRVEVRDGQAGRYECRMFLQPHYQLDELVSELKLDTTLAVGDTGGP
jgi:type VI secretion system ImpC/EvpB family protein